MDEPTSAEHDSVPPRMARPQDALVVVSQDTDRQTLVEDSSPVDGNLAEAAIKEVTISSLEQGSALAGLRAQEFADIIAHRKKWSNTLLTLVSFIVTMDFVVVIFAGLGTLQYSSSWTLPTFIGSSILEVFGLSYIVVQYLFPKSPGGNGDDIKDQN